MRARRIPLFLGGAVALTAAALVLAARSPSGAAGPPTLGTVTVTGSAALSMPPDQVQITLGTQVTASTAGAAMDVEARRMAAVVAALEGAGAKAADIATQGYAIQPDETSPPSGSPRITGYTVSDLVVVTTSRLAAAGELIDAAVRAGANQVQDVSFGLAHPGALAARADAAALADAHRRAEALAAQAGDRLGPLVSVAEGGGSPPVPYALMHAAAVSAPVLVPPQGVSVSAQVTAVYRLLP
ncbi:MAG: SIMPL domain-containing protein [Firmicutes bacterium]|nr:SIMPL domain-containing protein [Bacillota bacterium]